jgi:ABC-type phosphate transport system substrate-binding protein
MRRTSPRVRRVLLQLTPVIVVALLVGIAASDSGGSGDEPPQTRNGLNGAVRIDGAAAMRNVVDRAAQRFQARHPDVRVTVGASGDESAIALFCAGEIDLAAVARPLDRAERRACRTAGTGYTEIEVAREGIAVVTSEQNTFVGSLGLDQVRSIWRRASPALTWADVDPRFPAVPVEPVGWKPDSPPATLLAEGLFGPVDPLTRDDYEVADDSKEIIKAVASSPNAIGYLPRTQLKPGSGVRPVHVLFRPLYLDVSRDSLRVPEVRRFVREYIGHPPAIRASDGAVAVPFSHRVYRKFTRP